MRTTRIILFGLAALLFSFPTVALTQGAFGTSKPELHNLHDVQNALTACLRSPAIPEHYPGIRLTLRFSFNGHGAFEGQPRFTYVTPYLPDNVRKEYQKAILNALGRCTPLDFSRDLGAAIAGRPFVLRFDGQGLLTV